MNNSNSLKICPVCHKQIDGNSVFCNYCGCNLSQSSSNMKNQQSAQPQQFKPIYTNVNNANSGKKKKKGCLTSMVLFVISISIFGICTRHPKDDSDSKTETEYETTQESTETTETKKTFKESLGEYLDSSSVNDIMNILTNDLGFSESDIEFEMKTDGAEIYSIYLDGENFKMTALDNDYRIWNDTKVLYEDGTVKMTKQDIEDAEIDIGDDAVYYSFAKEMIEGCLKDPSSAHFPSLSFSGEVAMKKNKDLVVVQSNVTAKNSFGTKVNSPFTVEFQIIDMDNYQYNPIYINLDGEISGEYIDIDEY